MGEGLAGLTAVAAVLVAVMVYVGQSRRTDFEIARTLHLDLTSRQVARARELLGTLRYGSTGEISVLDPKETLTAYFTLLWCFKRFLYGRRALSKGKLLRRRTSAVRFLDDALAWHLVEWKVGAGVAKARLTSLLGHDVDDDDSRQALTALLRESGSQR